MIAHQRLGALPSVHSHNLALSGLSPPAGQLAYVCALHFHTCTGSNDSITIPYHLSITHYTQHLAIVLAVCVNGHAVVGGVEQFLVGHVHRAVLGQVECIGAGHSTRQAVALTHGLHKDNAGQPVDEA